MPAKDPFTHSVWRRRLTTMQTALRLGLKQPTIGVTQGGSSRKNAGARPAATDGLQKPTQPGDWK